MSDHYWRTQNLMLHRFAEPMEGPSDRVSRGVVNELAFEVFCDLNKHAIPLSSNQLEILTKHKLPAVLKFSARFHDHFNLTESNFDVRLVNESIMLSQRLADYFSKFEPQEICAYRPLFSGCGLLRACEGDLLVGKTLYEVKAGNRNFRVVDVRQLLTYVALNRAQGNATIDHIALLNPRTGKYWIKSIDTVCLAISGKNSVEMLDDLIEHFSLPAPYELG